MANRYWVGGTASWDNTAGTKWATTSGGTGGASVPTTADDVFFDASSGAVTCTVANVGGLGAKSITFTGFTGTFTGVGPITVSGNVTAVSGMTYTHTGTFTFNATATIISAGKSFSAITVNGSGITVTQGDALDLSSRRLTVTQGTYDTANYALTCRIFSSGTATRTINLGSSAITLGNAGSAATPNVDFTTSTNLTLNAGTSTITGTETRFYFAGGGKTFYDFIQNANSSGTVTITGANTFNNFTMSSTSANGKTLLLADNQTITGTFTTSAPSFSTRHFIFSDSIGTTKTVTAATFACNNCDFRDITFAGAGSPSSPSSAGDCGGNSGITFPSAKTVYRVGTNASWPGSNSWATSSGGTGANANFPLAQDTAVIDNSTALTGTLSTGVYNIGNFDCSNRTNGITISHSNTTAYGNYTLASGITISGTGSLTFSGRGTKVLISAGKTFTGTVVVLTPPGNELQLGDAFSSSNTLTLTNGTFNANNYNVTCTSFTSNNSNTRALTMGSGTWTLTNTAAATIWNLATVTGLTFNANTAPIVVSGASGANAVTFAGGGLTYNDLSFTNTAATGTITFTGANTFGTLSSSRTGAYSIVFPNVTTTVNGWSISGSSGNLVTLSRTGASGTFTLSKSGGGIVSADYLSISNSAASPSSTWYAGANSTDGGGNTGWIFTAAPSLSSGNFFLLF